MPPKVMHCQESIVTGLSHASVLTRKYEPLPLDLIRTDVLYCIQAVPMRERAGLGSASTPRPAGYRSFKLGGGAVILPDLNESIVQIYS